MTAVAETEARSAAGRGLALYGAAMLMLPLADGIAKIMGSGGAMSPGEVAWGRFMFHALLTLPMVVAFAGWGAIRPKQVWPNVLRGTLIAAGTTCFFVGLTKLPLADSTAIFFIQPLVLTIISAVFEKEQVGWRRWTAIAVGFAGALIVIRPSFSVFGPYALLPAVSAICFAFYMLLNRRQRGTDSPLTMQLAAGVAAFLAMSVFMVLGGLGGSSIFALSMPSAGEWAALAVMGAVAALAHMMIMFAFGMATGAVLAPCQFLQIVSATIFGLVVFGDFPDAGKWLGIAIVIACGAYVFWRETRRRRAA